MKRILILGPCGSGKTTFANLLAEKVDIPIYYLDQLYFLPGWIEPKKEEWQQKISGIIENDAWIIEGNYGGTLSDRLSRADTVVYLHSNTFSNFVRIIKRVIKFYGKERPHMAKGCKERFDLSFISYVLHFNFIKRPSIFKKIKVADLWNQTFFISSDDDRVQFISKLEQSLPKDVTN